MPYVPDGPTVPVSLVRRTGGHIEECRDVLAAEEPLEIRLREAGDDGEGTRFVVTMRTPGDDQDLVAGLLFGEGVVASGAEIISIGPVPHAWLDPDLARNTVLATLTADPGRGARVPLRATVMGSACGVCGRTSIHDVLALVRRVAGAPERAPEDGAAPLVAPNLLTSLPVVLAARQSGFASTGGLHAAGLFETDGTPLVVREDVGRHNATDKAVGSLLRAGRPMAPLLVVSGRAGFEIVQKAALAGVLVVASVSAPTSAAVALAEEAGVTLVGFLRGDRFNVYSHAFRIGT